MKILWGINGTGNGHITKSIHLINSAEKLGHEVDILISGKTSNIPINKYVKFDLLGFSFKYKNGALDFFETLRRLNLTKFLHDIRLDVTSYDMIVTDFEPITAWTARINRRKVLGISHQYSFIHNDVPLPGKNDCLYRWLISKYAPVDVPIGLHFQKYNSSIFLPIIRTEILDSKSDNYGHITVYTPGYDIKYLIDYFKKFGREVHIFSGLEYYETKKVKVFPLSVEEFNISLLNCDTIICGSGFETPSEALYLNKKIITLPLKGQWEQLANAKALSQLGVRVEKKVEDILSLKCNAINWKWQDPTDEILGFFDKQ